MKKLQLNQLLNSCQNQWTGIISRNKNFKVCLYGPNGHLKDLKADYQNDYDYNTKYREMEISFWEFREKDILVIELTW